MDFNTDRSIIRKINFQNAYNVEFSIKREDKIHPQVSGNKYRKLKYNLIEADRLGYKNILTFGGAFSNHIAAVATAGNFFGFKTIGIIRGDELKNCYLENPTLKLASQQGMTLKFVSRKLYKNKTDVSFLNALKNEFGDCYILPEGGTNALAVKGCEEIVKDLDGKFSHVCCPVGTGGTISGIINCSQPSQQVLGFPALKGSFLHEDISKFVNKTNWKLITDFHFGGYAKINLELISFINRFNQDHTILLDPVYTGKMMYGICNLIRSGYFKKGSKILAIHTGGIQGIEGMNQKLKHKNLPTIAL